MEGTRAHVRTPDGEADLRVPLLGFGNLQNVLAATAVAHLHGVPLDDVVERAAAAASGKPPWRNRETALRRDARGRLLQLEPRRTHAGARGRRPGSQPCGARWRCSARCSSSVRSPRRCTSNAGTPRSRPASRGWSPSAVHAAAALAGAARDAGLDDDAAVHVATSAEAGDLLLASIAPGDLGAGQGLARNRYRSGGRTPEGGVELMLYWLLYSMHSVASVLNVTRYITFRTAAASLTALVLSLLLGPWMIREAARFPGGAGDPPGGSGIAPCEGGHTDDGRAADPDGLDRPHTALGRPDQRVRLDCRDRDGDVRRDRIRRRLPEDHPAAPTTACCPATRWAHSCSWRSAWVSPCSCCPSTTCTARV